MKWVILLVIGAVYVAQVGVQVDVGDSQNSYYKRVESND